MRKPIPIPKALTTGAATRAASYYRRFLDETFRRFTLAGLLSDDEPVLLKQIYVPLVLTPQAIPDHAPERAIHKGGRDIAAWFDPALAKYPEIQPLFLVAGEAGSGKTTLIGYIVTSLAGTSPDDFNRHFDGYLPFPIVLREAPLDSIHSLDELIDWWLNQAQAKEPDMDRAQILNFLEHGRAILMLDGLDEVGSFGRRVRVISWLEHRWVRNLQQESRNLVVITARPSGFSNLTLNECTRLHVAPFSNEQIRTFLERWFELRPLSPTRRHEHIESLIKRLLEHERMTSLRTLSRRPSYLTSIAFVHGTRGALPHTRAALYDSLIDAYIDVLDRQRGIDKTTWDRQEKRDILAAVSFEAHDGATGARSVSVTGEREERRFSWTRQELVEAIQRAIQKRRFRTVRPEDAEELAEYYVARTGLLMETSEGRYQFGHLSFQEYLTALDALDRASGSANKARAFKRIFFDRLERPGWMEPTLLALAVDAGRTKGTGHRALLAQLDETEPSHVALIRELLSGEEVPLEPDERRAWLIAYLLSANQGLLYGDPANLAELASNQSTLDEVWHATANALLMNTSVRTSVAALLPPTTSNDDDLDDVNALEAPYKWYEAGREYTGLGPALLLLLPLLGGMYPSQADETLRQLATKCNLFQDVGAVPGIMTPNHLYAALCAWTGKIPELLPPLAERTPLSWLCADETFWWPPVGTARWGTEIDSPIALERRKAWHNCLAVERRIMVTTPSAKNQQWSDIGPLILPNGNDEQAHALHSRLGHKSSLRTDWFPITHATLKKQDAPIVALSEAHGLLGDHNTNGSWIPEIWKHVPLLRSSRVSKLLRLLQARGSQMPQLNARCCRAIAQMLRVVGINLVIGEPKIESRAEVVAEREKLVDPTCAIPDFGNPHLVAELRAEWEDLLQSPISPVPMLDAVLEEPFTELDATTPTVVAKFNQIADALIAEAGGIDDDEDEENGDIEDET